MTMTQKHNDQLQDAVSLLAQYMRTHAKGSVTFHLDGQGNLGERATVEITSTLKGQNRSMGIEVTFNQIAKVAALREAARVATTTNKAAPSTQ